MYELTNHLGNVMTTISDRAEGHDDGNGGIDYYIAEVLSQQEYYAFGMQMPYRHVTHGSNIYRYGFNGKENDNDVKGEGNQQDYGMRIYDPRIGRFLSVDPLTKSYPMLTPYQYTSNRPIDGVDIDGKEWAQSTIDTKVNETTINRVTYLYVKVKVINQSAIVTKEKDVRSYAEAFKSSVEAKYSAKGTYTEGGLTINHEVKTEVILDYTPEPPIVKNPDGTEVKPIKHYTTLTLDDRTFVPGSNSTPGDTKGAINAFRMSLAVIMNGTKVPIKDFKATSQHEGGHSGGLNHPWVLNADEIALFSELNQLDPAAVNKKTVLKNLMNSAENPDAKYKNDSGTDLLFNQLRNIINRVKDKARYTPAQLQSSNPEEERNKSLPKTD